jgi:predicted glycosyltransferase/peptidoglycan/xylan/chitin deacetylase (PgdA/CDA1 family)
MMLRVFIAVTHLLGAGHLTRAAAVARAFARAGHETTLVSGGMPAPLVALDGVNLVQLPPVKTAGTDFTTLLDEAGRPVVPDRLERRRGALLEAFRAARPDVLITELFPFGRRVLATEFMTLLEEARSRKPRPLTAASVRDILAAPTKPDRVAETHERLVGFYDAVLVHGDPDLVPLERSWPIGDELRPLIRYTGYVDEGLASPSQPARARNGIVVSGGSSAASLPLYRAAVEAARLVPDEPWRILVGAGVEHGAFGALSDAAPAHAAVERARPDFRRLLARAAASVSQAGYNTAVDLLRTSVAAVLVPFEAGRETEQRLRAERLAELGLTRVLPEAELSPVTLAEAVRAEAARSAGRSPGIALDGAAQTVAIVEKLARPAPPRAPVKSIPDWSPLDRVLRRTAEKGRTIAFWWRDDDAVAHTPALDRLLEVARAFDLSIAIAAIPGGVERSLMERLGDEPQAHVLVHGFAHVNYAPPGQKKAEFGPDRSPGALAHDAEAGLRLAQKACDGKLLPVFVPPWNRAAPELLRLLPRLGYRGFSGFDDRSASQPAPGLRRINANVDPIDWKGRRGLLSEEAIIAQLAAAVSARLDGSADPDEPIGLLTHHLIHDESVWRFCEALLDRLRRHDNLIYPSPRTLFP